MTVDVTESVTAKLLIAVCSLSSVATFGTSVMHQ
jgi:hypothetical protein